MSNPIDVEEKEVCLVDDDPSVLKSMHYLLASEGIKVRTFNKAEDFLAHASTHHVPVVVTDIWMDQVTGLEVLARLCAISPQDSCNCHYGARRSCRACDCNGDRSGCLFHEAVRRRKIHRGGSRRSQSKQEITKCRNERRGLRYDISKPSARMETQSQPLQRSRLLRFCYKFPNGI